MQRQPLYLKIYNDLESYILNGSLAVGDKVYTEAEIMGKYGVSRITATRALNELESNGYIERKRRIGSFVTNTKRTNGPAILYEKSKADVLHIALVTPYPANIGFDIFSYIIQNADKHRILTSIHVSGDSIKTESEILKNILQLHIDGLICVPVEKTGNLTLYMRLLRKGIPVVFLDRHLPWLDIPYVATNNFQSMYNLTEWAIREGNKKLAFFFNSSDISTESERLRGFLQALKDYDMPLDERFLLELDDRNADDAGKQDERRGRRIGDFLEFMSRADMLPDIIMCVNDKLAVQVASQARKLGMTIPDDIAITGFDNDHISGLLDVPLTTVEQNYNMMGKKALELMYAIKNKEPVPSKVLVDAPLLIRESTRGAEKGASKTSWPEPGSDSAVGEEIP